MGESVQLVGSEYFSVRLIYWSLIFPAKWLQHNESAGAPWPANWMKWSSFAHHRTLKGISNVLTGCNGYRWGNELQERSVHHQQWLSRWAEYDAQRKTLKREEMRGCTKNKLHIVQVIEDSKRHAQNTTEKIWKRLCSGAGAEQQAVNISVQLEKCRVSQENAQSTEEHNAQCAMHICTMYRAEHKAQSREHRAQCTGQSTEQGAASLHRGRNNDGESQQQ